MRPVWAFAIFILAAVSTKPVARADQKRASVRREHKEEELDILEARLHEIEAEVQTVRDDLDARGPPASEAARQQKLDQGGSQSAMRIGEETAPAETRAEDEDEDEEDEEEDEEEEADQVDQEARELERQEGAGGPSADDRDVRTAELTNPDDAQKDQSSKDLFEKMDKNIAADSASAADTAVLDQEGRSKNKPKKEDPKKQDHNQKFDEMRNALDHRKRRELSWASNDEPAEDQPKVNVYVITLDVGDKDRLPPFRTAWQQKWPSGTFTVIEGIVDSRRGFGCTASYVNALRQAVEDKCDICIVLEDDAHPFTGTKYPDDIVTEMSTDNGKQAGVVLLGGHHLAADTVEKPLTRTTHSWGSYAWAIRKEKISGLIKFWDDMMVNEANKTMISPDDEWRNLFTDDGIWVSTPLLIDHLNGKTEWGAKKMREDEWSGIADWTSLGMVTEKDGHWEYPEKKEDTLSLEVLDDGRYLP